MGLHDTDSCASLLVPGSSAGTFNVLKYKIVNNTTIITSTSTTILPLKLHHI
jgi:hypothetical protein